MVIEAVGTLFIWLDTVRLSAVAYAVGFASYEGEPKQFAHWYYHSATLGFALLFLGMLVAATVLWLQHREHVASLKAEQKTSLT